MKENVSNLSNSSNSYSADGIHSDDLCIFNDIKIENEILSKKVSALNDKYIKLTLKEDYIEQKNHYAAIRIATLEKKQIQFDEDLEQLLITFDDVERKYVRSEKRASGAEELCSHLEERVINSELNNELLKQKVHVPDLHKRW